MIRRLFFAAVFISVGYVIARADIAYGHAPWLIVCMTASVAWTGGWLRSHAQHSALTATAVRERDDACAIAVSLHEGATYQPLPSYIDQAEADRLNRHLRVAGDGR